MIAYAPSQLDNLQVSEAVQKACYKKQLSHAEQEAILQRYASWFYSPNFFIRIGLFLLTCVVLFFFFGLLVLIFLSVIDKAIGGMSIFFGLIAWACLEFVIKNNRHLQSGVDDALLWIAVALVTGGSSYLIGAGPIGNSLLVFFITLMAGVRFADRMLSTISFLALVAILFYIGVKIGGWGTLMLPFVIMVLSAGVYFWSRYQLARFPNILYQKCLNVLCVAALVVFYGAGNYYIVRELSSQLPGAGNSSMPVASWIWWLFTGLIPLAYVMRGILSRDILLLRTGIVLVAVIIFTVRYYIAFADIEIIMAAAGAFMLIAVYLATRFVKWPRRGFTNEVDDFGEEEKGKRQVESLLQAETLSAPPAPVPGFGGGSFGGGGASSEF